MIALVLAWLGLRPWHLLVMGVTVLLIPGAWYAGRWHQAGLDRVEDKINALEAETAARKAASDAAARLLISQAEATKKEHEARSALELEKSTLEDQARKKDRALDAALNFTCPPAVPASAPPLPHVGPVLGPAIPVLARPVCGYDDDELGGLLKRFPSGPIRQGRRPAVAR